MRCQLLGQKSQDAMHMRCKILEGLSPRPPPRMPPPPSRYSAYRLPRAFAAANPFSIIKGASALTRIAPFPMHFCSPRCPDHATITWITPGSQADHALDHAPKTAKLPGRWDLGPACTRGTINCPAGGSACVNIRFSRIRLTDDFKKLAMRGCWNRALQPRSGGPNES